MRRAWAEIVRAEMAGNDRIVVLTADLGYGLWDRVRAEFPDRFVNVGAAEQALIGIGVGLALAGRIPVCYSITPFLLYRPFELVRNYLQGEGIPVKLVGSGRDRDYVDDGPTHWAEEDRRIVACLPRIACYRPDSIDELRGIAPRVLYGDGPAYLNLRR